MPNQLLKKGWYHQPTWVHWVGIFLGYILFHAPAFLRHRPEFALDFYGDLANSLLHGELDLTQSTGEVGDLIRYHGHNYLPYPPFPAIIEVPYVWLTHHGLNTVLLSVLCGCANIYMLHRILMKVLVDKSLVWWLIAAFMFGSGFSFVVLSSYYVYTFAHVIAVTLCIGLLCEYFNKRRWWLIGILLGCSFLTRQFTVFYGVFALVTLFAERKEPNFWKKVTALAFPMVCAIGLYATYNYLRFGNGLETGYPYIIFLGVLKDRVAETGVFSLHYVPINIYYLFIKGFSINFTGKGMLHPQDVDLWGTSLLASAPYIVCAFKASIDRNIRIAAWGAILLMLPGILSYHNNGYEQVNTFRFALDFFPLLFLLVAAGASSIPRWLLRSLILYAIALNFIAFGIHFLSKSH